MRVFEFITKITNTSISFELAVRIGEITDAEIVVVSFYDDDITSVEIDEDLEELPVQIRCLGGESRFDYNAWAAFQDELSKGYDLVHTHHNFSGSVARLLSKRHGLPIVDTEHRDHSSFSLLQNIVNFPTLPLADCIVSNSQTTEDSFRWYERLVLKKRNQTVIYNGVDIDRIQSVVENATRFDDDTFRICTAGRMVPVKNQSALLHAFDSFTEQRPNAELILIGDGPLRDELEALARDLDIMDSVRFTGEVPRRRVYELFAQSDVFMMPSYAEGFCVAAVEAMASGLPVVVSDIPVFHEVLGECGIYVEADRPGTFVVEFENLLDNEQHRHEKAKNCQTRARSKFGLDRAAKEYFKVYKSIVE